VKLWAGVLRDLGRLWVGNVWNARKSLPDWFVNLVERPDFWASYLNIGRMYALDGDTIAILSVSCADAYLSVGFFTIWLTAIDDVIYISIPLKRFNGKIFLLLYTNTLSIGMTTLSWIHCLFLRSR
jgi:hypothetical protein